MYILLIILGTTFITFVILYEFLFSPQARIRILWKEIFKIDTKIGEMKNNGGYNPMIGLCEDIILKKKKMINALLDYYFNPEEDEEYIKENRPSGK